METLVKYNDPKINNGLPEGMSLADLKCGAIVETNWDDDQKILAMVSSVNSHRKIKGEFIVGVYLKRGDRLEFRSITQTQIVRLVHTPETILNLL